MIDIKNIDTEISYTHRSIYELSMEQPVMLVFLRHLGCIYCRESLIELSKRYSDWKSKNIKLILIHPSEQDEAEKYFEQFGFSEKVSSIADPTLKLYKKFGLKKGTPSQVFAFQNVVHGFQNLAKGIPMTLKFVGDGLQMPGIFIVKNGEICQQYIHKLPSDRPDYDYLASCCDI